MCRENGVQILVERDSVEREKRTGKDQCLVTGASLWPLL